jgi:hypothetical protein
MFFGEIYCYISALHRERICQCVWSTMDGAIQAWAAWLCCTCMDGINPILVCINRTVKESKGIIKKGLMRVGGDWVYGRDQPNPCLY